MRCRHFIIRFTTQDTHNDEARINEFLQGIHVHYVQTSVSAPRLLFSPHLLRRGSQPSEPSQPKQQQPARNGDPTT